MNGCGKIRQIVEFPKNGRIFYAGDDGHVHELKFTEPPYMSLMGFFAKSESRKVSEVIDHQQESIFMKLLPDQLRIKSQKETF